MKKTVTKLIAGGAALALLISAQPAAAQCCPQPDPCCNPCMDMCDMCGDWEIGAHALYWTPVACQFAYASQALVETTAGQIEPVSVSTAKCAADWGFRVFGSYLKDCSFFGMSYQWFESRGTDSTSGINLRIIGDGVTQAGLSRVTASQRLEYQNVDVRWGKFLHRGCGCSFYLFGNARWVDLSLRQTVQQKFDSAQTGLNTNTRTRKAELQGGALGVGVGANFDLWCDIGCFGEANLLGVIAERSTRDVATSNFVNTTQLVGGSRSTYPSDTCINPEVTFRLGLDYTWSCGCGTIVGEIGYELDYFWDAFALPNVPSQSPQLATSDWALSCQNVGFSGLFFGGKLLF